MAIIDLPQTRGFHAAQFQLGLDVSESTFTGALTGNRQQRSNLADRLRGTLLLPPTTSREAAAQREALLMALRSGGDWLRMGVPHRPAPLGNLRGAVVVAAAAAAGARSIVVSGGLAAPNLLPFSGFEIDSNNDGLADGDITPIQQGVFSGVLYSRVSGNGSTWAQQVSAAVLGPTAVDRAGIVFPYLPVPSSGSATFAADVSGSSNGTQVVLYLEDGVGGTEFVHTLQPGVWSRIAVTHQINSAATYLRPYLWMQRNSGGGLVSARFDNVQVQAGARATPYAGLPRLLAGDFISVGGNLLQVAYGGATLNDGGAGTIPLALPLQRPLAAGTVVNVSAPTGVWQLDDEGLQLDYSARNVQAGLALPLRQVVV